MKIVLFGASGTIGQRILAEAVGRGHQVTAVVRVPSRLPARDGVVAERGDVLDAQSVAQRVDDADAVVSAVSPDAGKIEQVAASFHALIAGLKQAGVKRLLVVGGAGSLEVAPGLQLVDAPDFPSAWKPVASAHRDALALLREERDLDWTYLSPAAMIQPGERTGVFRRGGDTLVTDANGESRISAEDFAIALVEELERPEHVRRRFTVAY
jgi:putative NADH-flavin reductase